MRDEWITLQEDNPYVAFNVRSFGGAWNSPDKGFRGLVQCEPYPTMRENWQWEYLVGYEKIITFSPKFFQRYHHTGKMILIDGCLGCNPCNHFNQFLHYQDKINGVCMLNKVMNTGLEGDIYWLRPELMNNLSTSLVRDIWCTSKWGGELYRGAVDSPLHHSHSSQLQKINEYRYCACFEGTYHPLWSSGFITERILNCFRAKTMPIYIGCWEIETYVPERFFIDFRKYWSPIPGHPRQYDKLSADLQLMDRKQYQDTVEEAYEWVQRTHIGKSEVLEDLLQEYK